jgi:hypothetical protein
MIRSLRKHKTTNDTREVRMNKETEIKRALASAKAIAWDGCHKIYVAMDEHEMRTFESYGYDPLIPVTDIDEAYRTLCEWWDRSCGLRFISAVSTNLADPNEGFIDLIPQCYVETEEDFYLRGTDLFARSA